MNCAYYQAARASVPEATPPVHAT